jgi:hypothetical protein
VKKNVSTNVISFKPGSRTLSLDEITDKIRSARSAEGVDLTGLTPGQRAMIGARLITVEYGARNLPEDAITRALAAKWMGVSLPTMSDARRVRKAATPKEIERIEAGGSGMQALADQLRAGLSPLQREAAAAVPLNKRGKSPERIHRQRLRAEIWRCLRDGLLGLTGLPSPRDVAQMVRMLPGQTVLVDQKLLRAQAWLEEFVDEWTRPSQGN